VAERNTGRWFRSRSIHVIMAILQTTQFLTTHLNANGTTTIFTPQATNQSSQAVLHTISINTKGAASNTISVYNDVTAVAANLIAVIDSTSAVQSLFYDAICNNGLTVVLATGTAADITVSWAKLNQA